ncbi:MAG: HEAT repeat domain-containing protein [Planctomycetes bacterium]|nr:HEAT repeat domain-containing protein [Planctomycetota bacterium]
MAMLKSANAQDRRSAAAALRRMGWQPKDATQQAWFFVGLEQWNDAAELGEAGLEPLTAMLNDPNPVIRQQAARVLHARGWQPKEASQGARFQAAQQEWTDRLKRGEAYEPLIAQLNHENLGMRQQAAKTLYHTGWRPKDPNQAARFIVLLEKWDEAAKLGAPACQPLIEAMRGGAEMRAAAAAKALATIGEPAVEPLLAALKTEGSFVKEWICEALITMDPPRVEPLIPLLKDPGRYTRRTAARALRKAKWEPKDTSQRAWLAMAAGEWGELNQLGDSGWEPLMAALKDKEPEIQQQAMNTLSFRRDPRALQLFLAALKGPDEHLRRGAMSGLCELVAHRKASDAQTVQALVAALRDWNCANQAVRALDMLQWQPQTAKDAVYWRLAWRQSGEIELHWADISKTLLEDLKANDYRTVENSVYAFIASGKEDMVTVLITTLNDKGEKSMAVTFFKCGQPSLSEAAKAWANSRKYELPAYPTPIPVKWGRWDSK